MGTESFSNFANIISGAGNDTFTFTGSGAMSGTLDAGAGYDTLNYKNYSGPISVAMSDPSSGTGVTYNSNTVVNNTIDPSFSITHFSNADNVFGPVNTPSINYVFIPDGIYPIGNYPDVIIYDWPNWDPFSTYGCI